MLEGLCILSVLGTSWGPPGETRKCRWGEGYLSFYPGPIVSLCNMTPDK